MFQDGTNAEKTDLKIVVLDEKAMRHESVFFFGYTVKFEKINSSDYYFFYRALIKYNSTFLSLCNYYYFYTRADLRLN